MFGNGEFGFMRNLRAFFEFDWIWFHDDDDDDDTNIITRA